MAPYVVAKCNVHITFRLSNYVFHEYVKQPTAKLSVRTCRDGAAYSYHTTRGQRIVKASTPESHICVRATSSPPNLEPRNIPSKGPINEPIGRDQYTIPPAHTLCQVGTSPDERSQPSGNITAFALQDSIPVSYTHLTLPTKRIV